MSGGVAGDSNIFQLDYHFQIELHIWFKYYKTQVQPAGQV